jgi:hypothetical protein
METDKNMVPLKNTTRRSISTVSLFQDVGNFSLNTYFTFRLSSKLGSACSLGGARGPWTGLWWPWWAGCCACICALPAVGSPADTPEDPAIEASSVASLVVDASFKVLPLNRNQSMVLERGS